jgi:hypothetical protein
MAFGRANPRAGALRESVEARHRLLSPYRDSPVVEHDHLSPFDDEGPFAADAGVALTSSVEWVVRTGGTDRELMTPSGRRREGACPALLFSQHADA